MTKTSYFQFVGSCHLNIRYSDLFRVSDFDIRIFAEQGFPFSHYIGIIPVSRCQGRLRAIFNWVYCFERGRDFGVLFSLRKSDSCQKSMVCQVAAAVARASNKEAPVLSFSQ